MWRLLYYTTPHVDTVSPSGWPYSKQPTRICGIPQIHNLLNPQILHFSKQGVQPSKSNVQGKTQDKYQLMIQWAPHAVYSIIKNLLFSSWHSAMARIFYTAKKTKKILIGLKGVWTLKASFVCSALIKSVQQMCFGHYVHEIDTHKIHKKLQFQFLFKRVHGTALDTLASIQASG